MALTCICFTLHDMSDTFCDITRCLFRFVIRATTSLLLDMFTFFVRVHCEKLPTAKLTEPSFLPVPEFTGKNCAIFGQDGGYLGIWHSKLN